MIINLMSDVHTEFWTNKDYFSPGEGDVLVLAGDVGMATDLLTPDSQFERFLNDCAKGYNKVFYVLGNHEHYEGDFTKSEELIRQHLPDKVTLLQNQSEFYEGVHFVGATMWSDFNNANPAVMEQSGRVMNDYHLVNHGQRLMNPADTLHEHDETLNWFNQVLGTLRGKKVVITHHCPSERSLSGRYTQNPGSYATNLTQLIETYSPDLWFHGHCHNPADYNVGSCRIISNPRGYAPDALNLDYSVQSYEV